MVVKCRWIETISQGKKGKEDSSYQQVYEATLIGGQLLAEYGPLPYQNRDPDAPGRACLDMYILRPFQHLSPTAPTLSERTQHLQKEFNELENRVSDAILTMIGTVTVINKDGLDGVSPKDLMAEIKQDKLLLYSALKASGDALGAPVGPDHVIKSYTIGLPPEVQMMYDRMSAIKQEISEIVGGTQMLGQYATTQTVQSNQQVSAAVTAFMDDQFIEFEQRFLSGIVNLLILLDAEGNDDPDSEAIMQNYAVSVNMRKPRVEAQEQLMRAMNLQNSQSPISSAMFLKAILEQNPHDGINWFLKEQARIDKEAADRAMQQQQLQLQSQQAIQESKGQQAAALADKTIQGKAALEIMKGEINDGNSAANTARQGMMTKNQKPVAAR
jgi:hypothetical protein